ncbi:uncharacterized protein LOC108281035 [Ictalurus punctatus]|uniref:Uncharacterized protein LOC108281035 n=1 Tax=Ictalurus punctatus TaxID=7998 RepID=A0A979EIA7_ICTPU|nr:uncharacterized protein LOC108281035 [Ictalurus punctatus]
MTLPGNHGDGGRYEYLPNTPRDLEDTRTVPRHDPEFSPKVAQKQNCLLSCCSSNMEEPSSFQSQTEDEDYMLEKTVGYLPLHHELDSGLGWTDGSFHQGELSGVETEEGLDECHAHQGGRGARVRGGSPSSESFISSELSDSGFYSVSTAEFLRFQRLLEKRMRVYNSRLHHQGELQSLCMDAQKAHRELEAIPEALAMQPDSEGVEMDAQPPQMVRVASVQLRKSERPCLNRHSTSSAAIFSTCSSPSGQQRGATPHASAGMLRRSRTLHHRPVHVEQRRRASHPASPNHCSVTLNRYAHALQQQLTEETETDVLLYIMLTTSYILRNMLISLHTPFMPLFPPNTHTTPTVHSPHMLHTMTMPTLRSPPNTNPTPMIHMHYTPHTMAMPTLRSPSNTHITPMVHLHHTPHTTVTLRSPSNTHTMPTVHLHHMVHTTATPTLHSPPKTHTMPMVYSQHTPCPTTMLHSPPNIHITWHGCAPNML